MKSQGGSRGGHHVLTKSNFGLKDGIPDKVASETWAAYEVKDKSKIEKLIGKYKPFRKRDFSSQICNLPGPKSLLGREYQEIAERGLKKHGVKQRDNQAFNSDIDDKFNAHKIDVKQHPSHRKAEVPLDQDPRRKDYDLKRFVLTETYDFLNPGKPKTKAF
jgi:hypothetical protein